MTGLGPPTAAGPSAAVASVAAPPSGPGGRRLRIAHLTTVDMSLALLLATELEVDVASGAEVFGLSAPGAHVAAVEALGVTHVPVASLSRAWDVRSDLHAVRDLLEVVRSLRLDVLHTHTPKAGVMGRVVGRLARVPVVVNTCHGLWIRPGDAVARRAAVLAAEALAAAFGDAELYQNDEDRRALRRWTAAGRQRTVGNGVDLERFAPDPAGRVRVRHELGVGDDVVLVGGIGRLVEEKGILEYVRAAGLLEGAAQFVWVGPEDSDKPDALGATGGPVRFLGMRSDMPDVYAALDVFVLPSHREGFSRSGMEAAACGVASVLSDIRGCREVGRHGESLLLVPPRDPVALAQAVGRLVADAPLRARLGSAARQRALQSFDQRQIAATSLEVYAAVASRKGLGWT